MTDEAKALVEQATRRAAILHASASWGSDEDGALIDRLLDLIEAKDSEIARLRKALRPFARADHIIASVDGDRIRCILTYSAEASQTFTLASLTEARAALGYSHDQ